MTPDQPYVEALYIHKVRHLSDIDIVIDEGRPRHLILTGPNGCGKTSVLRAVETLLRVRPLQGFFSEISEFRRQHLGLSAKRELADGRQRPVEDVTRLIDGPPDIANIVADCGGASVQFSNPLDFVDQVRADSFLLANFAAKRTTELMRVEGPKQLSIGGAAHLGQNLARHFLQFLVNQQNKKANYNLKGDAQAVLDIELWQFKLVERFRELFGEPKLELVYDIDKFDFTIQVPGREPVRLVDDQLSDGFSAIIQIIAELLMRMEAVSPGRFDVPGIALVDEIETHLHIELQKQILPFLTSFFPNVQFIVTTHSPFVLTSLADAVCFDLESRERWEHMGALSAATVIEEYFDADMYSAGAEQMLAQYRQLSRKTGRTAEEKQKLDDLRQQLANVRFDDAPELVTQFNAARLDEVEP